MRVEAWAQKARVPLGFAFAVAFAVFCRPTRLSIIVGAPIALAGLALRAAAAGVIAKDSALATGGPFRYTRNPLYLGSFILGAGCVAAGASLPLAVAFVALFALIYAPVMRGESRHLRRLFGEAYDAYARRTPLFLPMPGRGSGGKGAFTWRRYRINREYQAAAGAAAIFIFLIAKSMLR